MKIGTSRMETFSDGVMAIIITIMVLAIQLPDFKGDNTKYELSKYLVDSVPYFVSYAFSFMMIGIFWTNHHHLFHLLRRTDELLIWLNLIFLFFISLIPLVTTIVSANPFLADSVAFYGAIMLMTTLFMALMRTYTLKKHLAHEAKVRSTGHPVETLMKKAKRKNFLGAASYLLSVPAAFVNVYISYALFLVPPILFFIPDGVEDEGVSEEIIEGNNATELPTK
jgi:uncharacterized membrane protein